MEALFPGQPRGKAEAFFRTSIYAMFAKNAAFIKDPLIIFNGIANIHQHGACFIAFTT